MNSDKDDPQPMMAARGSVPVPDPTFLTTQNLRREVQGLQELIALRIEGLSSIMEEKFRAVDQQLALVERGRVEQKEDTKAAVDAAFTAQKEAVKEQTTAFATATGKSETAIFKAVDQLSEMFASSVEALRRAIDEVKERFTRELSEMKDRVSEVDRNLRETISAVDMTARAIVNQKEGGEQSKAGLYAAIAAIGLIVLVVLAVLAARGSP